MSLTRRAAFLLLLFISLYRSRSVEGRSLRAGADGETETVAGNILKTNDYDDASANPNLHDIDIMREPGVKQDELLGHHKRNAIINGHLLWSERSIPYTLNPSLSGKTKDVISKAMAYIENKTGGCITYRRKVAGDKTWLDFFKGTGCWSYIGRVKWSVGGVQKLSIGEGCESVGVVLHEMLHSLGFWHEQSRSDRDKYVEIKYENIIKGREKNFKRLRESDSHNLNSPYDYVSAMHYGKKAFTIHKDKDTIVALKDSIRTLGQRRLLSYGDIASLKTLYHCQVQNNGGVMTWTHWSEFSPCYNTTATDDGYCEKKRYRFCLGGDSCTYKGYLNFRAAHQDTQNCTDSCYRDGHWGPWLSWSACNAQGSCVTGTKERRRRCDDPYPQHGGKACEGAKTTTVWCESKCPKTCTFNEDTCSYTASGLWVIGSGATPSLGTGPGDDASGDGRYMYTETSGVSAAKVSKLTSPIFSGSAQPQCYAFKYHMWGNTIGRLTLSMKPTGGESGEMWSLESPQENKWKAHNVTVSSTSPFKMEFTAVSRRSWTGDIAVDDLMLTPNACNDNGVASANATTLPPQPPTTEPPTPPPPPGVTPSPPPGGTTISPQPPTISPTTEHPTPPPPPPPPGVTPPPN